MNCQNLFSSLALAIIVNIMCTLVKGTDILCTLCLKTHKNNLYVRNMCIKSCFLYQILFLLGFGFFIVFFSHSRGFKALAKMRCPFPLSIHIDHKSATFQLSNILFFSLLLYASTDQTHFI